MPSDSQIPIASKDRSKRFAARLALFYGTTFGTMGTHLPFFTVWLKAVGIDASWIGIISAVPALTRFTVLPFVTSAAEKHYSLRGALTVTALATALGFALIGTQYLPLAVLLAYAATCSLWTPMVPLTDAYALRGVARYGLNYGPLRLWGSARLRGGCADLWIAGRYHRRETPDLGHRIGRNAGRICQPRAAAAGPAKAGCSFRAGWKPFAA
jgi:PPP family 3-phenylpropionic acid transporter